MPHFYDGASTIVSLKVSFHALSIIIQMTLINLYAPSILILIEDISNLFTSFVIVSASIKEYKLADFALDNVFAPFQTSISYFLLCHKCCCMAETDTLDLAHTPAIPFLPCSSFSSFHPFGYNYRCRNHDHDVFLLIWVCLCQIIRISSAAACKINHGYFHGLSTPTICQTN